MVKKGPIGKAEDFYILHHYETMTAKELATDLNRNVKAVENHITKIVQRKAQEHSAGMKAGDQFHYHKGATVMTENASTISDVIRGKQNKLNEGCVTRIK